MDTFLAVEDINLDYCHFGCRNSAEVRTGGRVAVFRTLPCGLPSTWKCLSLAPARMQAGPILAAHCTAYYSSLQFLKRGSNCAIVVFGLLQLRSADKVAITAFAWNAVTSLSSSAIVGWLQPFGEVRANKPSLQSGSVRRHWARVKWHTEDACKYRLKCCLPATPSLLVLLMGITHSL